MCELKKNGRMKNSTKMQQTCEKLKGMVGTFRFTGEKQNIESNRQNNGQEFIFCIPIETIALK